jgi:hypothetical protein
MFPLEVSRAWDVAASDAITTHRKLEQANRRQFTLLGPRTDRKRTEEKIAIRRLTERWRLKRNMGYPSD